MTLPVGTSSVVTLLAGAAVVTLIAMIAAADQNVETQDWVEKQFRAHGLQNIHRLPFDLTPQWTPASWDLTFTNGSTTIRLPSARPAVRTPSTPPAGLAWDLVYAGTGTTADYLGRDVKREAALQPTAPQTGGPFMAAALRQGGLSMAKARE